MLAAPEHVWLVVLRRKRCKGRTFPRNDSPCINAAVHVMQENCRAGQPGAKPKAECVQKTNPVLEAVYSMYSPEDIASQLQYHTKG